MLLEESLNGLVGLVIHTDLPTTWHFADSMCAFCTGCPSIGSTALWTKRYFKEMCIDPKSQPYEREDVIGKMVMSYPNPYVRHMAYVQTQNYKTPCAPWVNPHYASDGSGHYADLHNKTTLQGKLLDPSQLASYTQAAQTSVIIFFKKKLHELLYAITDSRARVFCKCYPNASNGQYHEVLEVGYVEFKAETCSVCGYYKCACGRMSFRK